MKYSFTYSVWRDEVDRIGLDQGMIAINDTGEALNEIFYNCWNSGWTPEEGFKAWEKEAKVVW